MATYGDMQTRMASESLQSGMTAEIKLCIQEAIKAFSDNQFWFLHSYDETFSTVNGQKYYGTADNSDIPNFTFIDTISIIDGTSVDHLQKVNVSDIERWTNNTADRGKPTHFAFTGSEIRLYPIPSTTVYTCTIIGSKLPATLVADGDSNAWTNEGEILIRNKALSILYRNYLRFDEAAQRCEGQVNLELDRLLRFTSQRQGSGIISPYL